MYDLVIRGGEIHDGSGGEPFTADVAVKGGNIIEVGHKIAGSGRQEINANGMVVTPGFVDIHSHYDAQVTWEQRLAPSSGHGVTTVVMGNCAIGLAPCRPEDRDLLINVIAGVEDIPEPVMAAGIPWNWETFPEYLDALANRHTDIDFAAQVPHTAVRISVMGRRGADREPANAHDMERMTALVAEGIRAGAVGVSTSHSISHRRLDGALAPCETSGEAELLAIARGVKEAGSGVFEIIIDFDDLDESGSAEFEMLKRIAKEANAPLSYTLVQSPVNPNGWRTLLKMTEDARQSGLQISGQIAPKAVGMCYGLDLSFNPFCFNPSYRKIADLPLSERVERMRDPAVRSAILAEAPEGCNATVAYLLGLHERMFVLRDPPNYEPSEDMQIGAMARNTGKTTREVIYDYLLEDGGNSIIYCPVTNFHDGTLNSALEMMKSDATIIALGDGGAHYGLICDAAYPTFCLTHWVRDRQASRLPLSWMIHSLTRKPALAVGFADRGLVRSGYKADLNVIDLKRLALSLPEVRYDLPGGGRRLTQRADGYVATVVSGVVTYKENVSTGAFPGRLVRGPQAEPKADIVQDRIVEA